MRSKAGRVIQAMEKNAAIGKRRRTYAPRDFEKADFPHRVLLVMFRLAHLHAKVQDDQGKHGAQTQCQPPNPFDVRFSKYLEE